MTYIFEELHKIRLKENFAQDLDIAQKNMARLSQKETGQDKKDYQSVARALNQGNLGAVKKVIKSIKSVEIQADILNVLVGYNDLIAKMYPKAVDSKGRLKTPMNVGTLIKEDEEVILEASAAGMIDKLFNLKGDKDAGYGVAKMLNITGVKVVQQMQKQNPKGFMDTVKALGKDNKIKLATNNALMKIFKDAGIKEETDFDELAELVENIQKVIKLFPRDNDWKKLITKHRRDIDALRRGKDLPQKVQDELMSWAMDNGEIKTDDVDELDDFIMTIIDA